MGGWLEISEERTGTGGRRGRPRPRLGSGQWRALSGVSLERGVPVDEIHDYIREI